MVVKLGCGVGIYKEINGIVEEIYYDRLTGSSGSLHYWIAKYEGNDYIIYTSASSDEYRALYTLKNGELIRLKTSSVINYTNSSDYRIDYKSVSKTEYNNYVNSIEFIDGMTIDGLK